MWIVSNCMTWILMKNIHQSCRTLKCAFMLSVLSHSGLCCGHWVAWMGKAVTFIFFRQSHTTAPPWTAAILSTPASIRIQNIRVDVGSVPGPELEFSCWLKEWGVFNWRMSEEFQLPALHWLPKSRCYQVKKADNESKLFFFFFLLTCYIYCALLAKFGICKALLVIYREKHKV